MTKLLTSLLLAAALGATSADLSKVKTSATSKHFYDEHGRALIFHGANRVWKGEPWYFQNQVDNTLEYEMFKKLGFNVVRLGYMWSGVEPNEGEFNSTYTDIVEGITGKFADAGVYTLFDLHEDILSSKYCLYDGAPLWLVEKSEPKHDFPWPLQGNCSSRGWMKNAFAQAPQQAYQDIYDNNHGMLDSLINMWAHTADRFKGNTNIIGYEVMNEPFAGDTYSDPTLFLPGIAGKKNLARMNEAVAKAIRAVDEDAVVFFEPVTWGMIFDGDIAGSGYDQVPGGEEFKDRSVFSYHYYCSTFSPSYNTKPFMQRVVCDKTVGPLVFKAVEEDLAKFGGSAMMTEGMACGEDDMDECVNVSNLLDSHLFSFTDYGSSQGSTFEPSETQQYYWARSYARATAGEPISMTFDINSENKAFDYCYSLNVEIDEPTEVFASSIFHYINGAEVTIDGNVEAVESGDADLYWFKKTAAATEGEKICIKMTTKK
ncbi:hypothetical protein TL16_g02943 [Triparma laevis f. inornata]|uniref:Uncharacterized protein n=1 Tax=Triparma laevis f. inornata TaxID=1714386 RepID=A0A9W6ZZ65_9STRA|nr:hypothetical protein TL16_g02943 [Triparma laevis f. inornata]